MDSPMNVFQSPAYYLNPIQQRYHYEINVLFDLIHLNSCISRNFMTMMINATEFPIFVKHQPQLFNL